MSDRTLRPGCARHGRPRQGQREYQPGAGSNLNPARSLAERMREAAQGIDRDALAGRATGLQQDRQAEERQQVQEWNVSRNRNGCGSGKSVTMTGQRASH